MAYPYEVRVITCVDCGEKSTINFDKENGMGICSDCNGTKCFNCCRKIWEKKVLADSK